MKQKTYNKMRKKEKGPNRMVEPCNLLTASYDNDKEQKYLNVSVGCNSCHADMAEWLLQLVDRECPSGVEGSIPSAGVTCIFSEDFE